MARTDTLENFLTDIANGIREKTGETGKISPDKMDVVIKEIPSGGDLSEYFAETSTSYNAQSFIKKMPPMTLTSGYQSFMNFKQLEEAPVIKNCSEITSFFQTFYGCSALKSVELDFSSATSYYQTFGQCNNLESIKILNFGKNLGNKSIDCQAMFYSCYKLTNLEIEIDFLKISACSSMFSNCRKLSNIQTLFGLFKNTSSYTGSCNSMFTGCEELQGSVNLDITNANNVEYIFSYCKKLNRVESLKNEKSTSLQSMFYSCYELEYADLSELKCVNVSRIGDMFYDCLKLKYIDIRNIRPASSLNSTNMLRNVPKTCEIYINQELYDKLASVLSNYTNVHIVPGYWEE